MSFISFLSKGSAGVRQQYQPEETFSARHYLRNNQVLRHSGLDPISGKTYIPDNMDFILCWNKETKN
jgi:hypothetical protein